METTKRFENAVTKLYSAFHKNEMNAYNCSACAVGNICNGESAWKNVLGFNGSECEVPSVSLVNYNGHTKNIIKKTGYTPEELGWVELKFMKANPYGNQTKSTQFQGLCNVVEYLCELDGIPNVMDFKSLFETENGNAVKQLSF